MLNVRPRSLSSRISASLLLLFHLVVAGLGPIADARLEAQAHDAEAQIHVESDDLPPCSSGHNHDLCLICRVLQSFDTPSNEGALLRLPRARDARSRCASWVGPVARSTTSSLGPRAPPLV
ncbi:MAG: hypothetical protein GEU90_18315 [Gemmatimonas sp.]|nr:hypothetical protein [Gemmatimonas sp.]